MDSGVDGQQIDCGSTFWMNVSYNKQGDVECCFVFTHVQQDLSATNHIVFYNASFYLIGEFIWPKFKGERWTWNLSQWGGKVYLWTVSEKKAVEKGLLYWNVRVILIYTMMDAGSCQACLPAIIQTVTHLITSSKLDKRVRKFDLGDFCSLFINSLIWKIFIFICYLIFKNLSF